MGFEAVVTTDQVGATCERLGLLPPAALQGSSVIREGDPEREAVFARAWDELVAGGLVPAGAGAGDAAEGSDLATALRILAEPEILVTIQRQDDTHADAVFIATGGTDAAEHDPLGPDEHRFALLRVTGVGSRVSALCGLEEQPAEAAEAPAAAARLSAADLLAISERVSDGDVHGAITLAAGRPDEAAVRNFIDAMANRRMAVQVAVTHYAAPGRLEGTSTAWVDGGTEGLWRIPRPTVSPLYEAERADNGDLDGIDVELSPVTAGQLLAEIFDGYPMLVTSA